MLGNNMPRGATHCARVDGSEGFAWLWARFSPLDGSVIVFDNGLWGPVCHPYTLAEVRPLNMRTISND